MTAAAGLSAAAADLPALAERFDVFLLDQFGVLHDGNAAYPGAVAALEKLKEAGKTVALLSNSGKRSGPNEERLAALGFRPDLWDLFLSSGEVAWRIFAGRTARPGLKPGTRCLLLSRDNDRTAVEGLDISLVEDGRTADLVLLSGSEGEHVPLDHYRTLLAPAAEAGVPLICTNPDMVMLTKSGPRFGAGRIALLYKQMGGQVTWIGKPYPEIYEAALKDLGQPARTRIVAVGDSVEHDIAGARSAGISAALVRSGILSDMEARDLESLYRRYGAVPDFLLPRFVWEERAG